MNFKYFLTAAVVAAAVPSVQAQDANVEGRVVKLEKEMKAVQRKVFPDGAGKFFEPEIQADAAKPTSTAAPSGSAVTDLIARVDALESQLATLTGQVETQNVAIKAMDARINALEVAKDPSEIVWKGVQVAQVRVADTLAALAKALNRRANGAVR